MDVLVRHHPDPALREEGTAFLRRLKFLRLCCNRWFLDFAKMSVRFLEEWTIILPLRQRSWGAGQGEVARESKPTRTIDTPKLTGLPLPTMLAAAHA